MSEILKRGSRGAVVTDLQRSLNKIHPSLGSSVFQHSVGSMALAVDGVFGSNTDEWVREFQKRSYLKVDGKVGPNTRMALRIPAPSAKTNKKLKPTPVVLYIHGDGLVDKGVTFTKHKNETCIQEHFSPPQGLGVRITAEITQNNYSIKELVINTHGGGGGTIFPFTIAQGTIKLSGPPVTGLITQLKRYFTPNCVITIYACSIASYKVGVEDGPRVYGAGIKEMKVLARVAGIPVRGGFSSQSSTSGNFVGPWVQINSAGYWTMHKGTFTKWDGVWHDFVRKIEGWL